MSRRDSDVVLTAGLATFTSRRGENITVRISPPPPPQDRTVTISSQETGSTFTPQQADAVLKMLGAPKEIATWAGPPF